MKPILFNTEMVRAILDGRKTCTRRICKDGDDYTIPDMQFFTPERRTYAVHNFADKGHTEQLSIAERPCPICPGDILYVRETWRAKEAGYPPRHSIIEYKAGGTEKFEEIIAIPTAKGEWKPSIHMPKRAARLFLRVANVRVERLQEITDADARAEGVGDSDTVYYNGALQCEFAALWDSTIPKDKLPRYGWDANPWVWVIEFERISKEEALNETNL